MQIDCCYLGLYAKFYIPRLTPSGKKDKVKERRKYDNVNSGYSVLAPTHLVGPIQLSFSGDPVCTGMC